MASGVPVSTARQLLRVRRRCFRSGFCAAAGFPRSQCNTTLMREACVDWTVGAPVERTGGTGRTPAGHHRVPFRQWRGQQVVACSPRLLHRQRVRGWAEGQGRGERGGRLPERGAARTSFIQAPPRFSSGRLYGSAAGRGGPASRCGKRPGCAVIRWPFCLPLSVKICQMT